MTSLLDIWQLTLENYLLFESNLTTVKTGLVRGNQRLTPWQCDSHFGNYSSVLCST